MKRVILLAIGSVALAATSCNGWDPFSITARNRTSPALRSFDSCVDLHAALQAALSEEMKVQLLSQQAYGGGRGVLAGGVESFDNAAAPTADGDTGSQKVEGVDYSGTNNQETGVDEADFVKTDGDHIYVLNGNRLEILAVPTVGGLEAASTTEIEGWPHQMLIGEGAVVVFSSISVWDLPDEHPLKAELATETDAWSGWWFRSQDLTKITVVDVTNIASPSVSRELYIEGYFQTGRRIESSVRMVSYGMMDIPNLHYWPEVPETFWYQEWNEAAWRTTWQQAIFDTITHNDEVIYSTPLEDFLPQIYERLGGAMFIEHGFAADDCRSFAMADDGMARGVTSILSLDLLGDGFAFDHDHIITNWSQVYASADVMLIAEPANDWWWFWDNDAFDEATNIHRFDISEPGLAKYTGSGRIDGVTRDQFSFSELNGFVRVAATTGMFRWWRNDSNDGNDGPENHVFVLAGPDALEVVGHLGGIAMGEQIWSSRFVGNEGFLVTFRNVDPLWTIDLSDPYQPVIKGELEVPGVSTYIHPLDGHLLTIGYSGNNGGLDWNAQVSLFDVTDFEHPLLADALPLVPPSPANGWASAWSEALYEHKAFTYWQGLLAIPLSTYRGGYDAVTGEYTWQYFSRLQLIHVDLTDGLSLFGEVDHSGFFNSDPEREWWWYNTDIRRTIFMLDDQETNYVYAISDRGVTAHRIDGDTLVPTASVALAGQDQYPYWWW